MPRKNFTAWYHFFIAILFLCATSSHSIAAAAQLGQSLAPQAGNASSSTNTDTLLVLGDSLSAGYNIPLEKSWPALLQASLDDAAIPLEVVNISISGETTAGGLARLPDALQRWHPRIVMIALGANDGLRGKSLAQVEKNLEAMLRMVASADASAVLVGMHIPPNFGPRYGQAFHAIYARLAKRYSVQLLPFLLDGVATDSALMQDDGLHPTADAQPRIRDHVLQSLQPLLKKIAAS